MWRAVMGCSALLALAAGCGGPAKIDVEPERPLITSKSEGVQLRAVVKDEKGKALSSTGVTFTSMTPTMASVDESGNVRGIVSGSATILVRAGKLSKEVEVLIQLPKKITITPDSPMMMMGVTKGFKATVINDRDQPMIAGEIRWSSSDPETVSVDKDGNVKTIKEGKATLTAFAAGIQGSTEVTVKHEELHEDGSLSQ